MLLPSTSLLQCKSVVLTCMTSMLLNQLGLLPSRSSRPTRPWNSSGKLSEFAVLC